MAAERNDEGFRPCAFMLLGDARTMDERGFNIEKAEHLVLDNGRTRDERTANRRGARIQAFGRGQIR